MPVYDKRIIKSGKIIEIYEYTEKVLYGYKNKGQNAGRNKVADEENKIINREKSLARARQTIRRTVNSNMLKNSKFVTLTFAENITDLQKANYEFEKFIKRLKYKIGFSIKYLVVPEFQKRGSIHYHCLMFNLPYIANNDLKTIWQNGFVKINKIDNVDNVGAYVCKYLQKANCDDRIKENKCFFTSKGLEKSVEMKIDSEKQKTSQFESDLLQFSPTYEKSFTNDYNTITYKQYILPCV